MKRLKGRYLAVVSGCALFTAVLGAAFDCTGLIFAAVIQESAGITISTSAAFWTMRALVNGLSATLMTRLYLKTSGRIYLIFLGLACSLCYIPMVFYTRSFMWLLSAVALGICNAGQILALVSTLNKWFRSGIGTLMGVCNAAGGLLTFFAGPLLSRIIGRFGWRAAALSMGAVILLVILLCALVLIPDSPERVGLIPFGETSVETGAGTNTADADRDRLRTKHTWLIYLMILVVSLNATTIYGLASHMPTYAGSLGYTLSVGGMLTSIMSVTGIVTKLLCGILCDRIGAWKTAAVVYVLLGSAAALLILLNSSVIGLAIMSAGLGMSFTPFSMLMPRLCSASFGTHYEKAFGRLNMLVNLINTALIYLLGIVLQSEGGFPLAFRLAILFCLAALAVITGVFVMKRHGAT